VTRFIITMEAYNCNTFNMETSKNLYFNCHLLKSRAFKARWPQKPYISALVAYL
jgi:hypothetical protein